MCRQWLACIGLLATAGACTNGHAPGTPCTLDQDCDDTESGAWAVPGEASELREARGAPAGTAVLTWSAPTTGRPIVCPIETASMQLKKPSNEAVPTDQNSPIGTSPAPPRARSPAGFKS